MEQEVGAVVEMAVRKILKFVLLAIILAGLYYLSHYSAWAPYFALSSIRSVVEMTGAWSYIVFPVLYGLLVVMFVPGTVLTFIGALLFGTLQGSLVNLIGATFGACLCFWLSEWLGRGLVKTLMRGRFAKLNRKLEQNAFRTMLLLRLFPVFPYLGINYAAGLSRIRFHDYFWATLVGMIPGVFVYTYLFSTLGRVVLADGISWGMLTWQTVLPLVLFVLLLLSPYLFRRWRKSY